MKVASVARSSASQAATSTASASDLVEQLLVYVDANGGRLAARSAGLALRRHGKSYTEIVKAAGGLRGFCDQHSKLEFVQMVDQDYIMRSELFADAVAEKLLASVDAGRCNVRAYVVPEVMHTHGKAFAKIVKEAGGLKNFIGEQDDLEFFRLACKNHRRRANISTVAQALQSNAAPLELATPNVDASHGAQGGVQISLSQALQSHTWPSKRTPPDVKANYGGQGKVRISWSLANQRHAELQYKVCFVRGDVCMYYCPQRQGFVSIAADAHAVPTDAAVELPGLPNGFSFQARVAVGDSSGQTEFSPSSLVIRLPQQLPVKLHARTKAMP